MAAAESMVTNKVGRLLTIARDFLLCADDETKRECAHDLLDVDLGFGAEFSPYFDEELRDIIEERNEADEQLYQLRLGLLGIYRAAEITRLANEQGNESATFGKLIWWDVFEVNASVVFDQALDFADTIISAN